MNKFFSFLGYLSKITFRSSRSLRNVFEVANSVAQDIKVVFRVNRLVGGNVQRTLGQILSLSYFSAIWV